MRSLTFEHVHKTFLFFERMGFSRPKVGKQNEYADNDLLAEKEWLELFCRVSPEDFCEAAKLCARSCKFWPKPADMRDALKEAARLKARERSFIREASRERRPIPKEALALLQSFGFMLKHGK